MTTAIISEAIRKINSSHKTGGITDVWYDKYKITLYFDCQKREIKILKVKSGVFLSHGLNDDILPEEFDEDFFRQTMALILWKRIDELEKEEEEQRRINEEEEIEREGRKTLSGPGF